LAKGFRTEPIRRSHFVGSVTAISEDQSVITVKLCTGTVFDVPTSTLKNLTHLGTVTYDNERCGLASAEIDISTDTGLVIQQMALEIIRLCQLSQTGLERALQLGSTERSSLARVDKPSGEESEPKMSPNDSTLPKQTFKVPFARGRR
jgi:hypothetical protein